MKKLLILLLLSSNLATFALNIDFSSESFCNKSPKVQTKNGVFYLPNQQEPFTGENLCIYESNGRYHSQGNILNGLQDGKWMYWRENGEMMRKEEYIEGDLTRVLSYENGQILDEENYKNGKKVGKWIKGYENAQIKSDGNYKDDKKDGKWMYWNKSGQLLNEENYKDGKKDGKWVSWSEDGKKEKEEFYKDGKLID